MASRFEDMPVWKPRSSRDWIEHNIFLARDAEQKLAALKSYGAPPKQIAEMEQLVSKRRAKLNVRLNTNPLPSHLVPDIIQESLPYYEDISFEEALKSENLKTGYSNPTVKKAINATEPQVAKKGINWKTVGKVGKVAAQQVAINLLFPGNFWANLASTGAYEGGLYLGKKFNRPLWQRYGMAFAGVAATNIISRFSGRDDEYNTIEGLHPGGSGFGAQLLKANSDFGSGYINKIKDAFGVFSRSSKVAVTLTKENMREVAHITSHQLMPGLLRLKPLETAVMAVGFGELGHIGHGLIAGGMGPAGVIGGLASFAAAKYAYVGIKNRKVVKKGIKGIIQHPKEAKEGIVKSGKVLSSYIKKGDNEIIDQFITGGGGKLGKEYARIAAEEKLASRFGISLKELYESDIYKSIPGKDDAYNIIEGLKHGGMAEHIRKALSDFGSGWDAARALAKSIYKDVSPNKAFKMLRQSDEWVNMLKGAKQVKELSFGVYGTTYLMEGNFRGEVFKFIKKVPKTKLQNEFIPNLPTDTRRIEALKHEYSVMPKMEDRIAPSPYGYNKEKNELYMELMSGKTLHEHVQEGSSLPIKDILTKIRREAKVASGRGVRNVDIHSGNVMYDETTGRVAWIDWGLGKTSSGISRGESNQFYEDMLSSIRDDLTPQIQSQPRKIMQKQEDFFDFGSLNFDEPAKTPNLKKPVIEKTLPFSQDKTFPADRSKAVSYRMKQMTNQQIQNSFKTAAQGARKHRQFHTTGR